MPQPRGAHPLEPPERPADQVDRFHRRPPRGAVRSPEPAPRRRHGDRDGELAAPRTGSLAAALARGLETALARGLETASTGAQRARRQRPGPGAQVAARTRER